MLTLVWNGFDRLKRQPRFASLDFSNDYAQLERSLTSLHMQEITLLWRETASAFESFMPQHESWELQNITLRSARPPSCDLGFVLLSNRRIQWAVEAKVLRSPGALAEYLADLQKYLDGSSAPFSNESALGAYLVAGISDDVFAEISKRVKCVLKQHPDFSERPHRCSEHTRSPEATSRGLSALFVYHHLVFSLN